MTKIVEVMDPQLDLATSIKALAERHRGRGILNDDYDRIGYSFVWALNKLRSEKDSSKRSKSKDESQSTSTSSSTTAENTISSANSHLAEVLSEKVVEAWGASWHMFAECMKVRDDESETPSSSASSSENKTAQVEERKMEEQKTYTLEEVAKHNTPDDLWVVVEGNVYDLTKYFPRHPGGEMMLLGAGKDATQLFLKNFHSKRARAILPKFVIGKLVGDAQ